MLGVVLLVLCPFATAQVVMNPNGRRAMLDMLPVMADGNVEKDFASPATFFWNSGTMPRVYQSLDNDLLGIFPVSHNGFRGEDPTGNARGEFPWRHTGGTEQTQGVETFKSCTLPAENGKMMPIVWARHRAQTFGGTRAEVDLGYRWWFPIGTTIYEVITMRTSSGHKFVFEIRERVRDEGQWNTEIYRPFVTAVQFADWIEEHYPAWEDDEYLPRYMKDLRRPDHEADRVTRSSHPAQTFRMKFGIDMLPELGDPYRVLEIFSNKKFEAVSGGRWKEGVSSPSSLTMNNIVPQNYTAHHVGVEFGHCAQCHRDTNRHVSFFQRRANGNGSVTRSTWRGRVSGSDGIISFHPFERASIRGVGGSQPRPITMNKTLTEAGMLRPLSALPEQYRSQYTSLTGIK